MPASTTRRICPAIVIDELVFNVDHVCGYRKVDKGPSRRSLWSKRLNLRHSSGFPWQEKLTDKSAGLR